MTEKCEAVTRRDLFLALQTLGHATRAICGAASPTGMQADTTRAHLRNMQECIDAMGDILEPDHAD